MATMAWKRVAAGLCRGGSYKVERYEENGGMKWGCYWCGTLVATACLLADAKAECERHNFAATRHTVQEVRVRMRDGSVFTLPCRSYHTDDQITAHVARQCGAPVDRVLYRVVVYYLAAGSTAGRIPGVD